MDFVLKEGAVQAHCLFLCGVPAGRVVKGMLNRTKCLILYTLFETLQFSSEKNIYIRPGIILHIHRATGA